MDATSAIRVLYIEDEPLARWTGAKILEKITDNLLLAESCAQAQDAWQNNEFDVIVSDYRLDDGLATDLISRMRERRRREPVIMLSGESEEFSKEMQSSLGIVAVLKKPLDQQALGNAIRSIQPAAPSSAEGAHAAAAETGPSPTQLPLPVWIGPEWSGFLRAGNPAARFELAPGRDSVSWILMYDALGRSSVSEQIIDAIRVTFRQLVSRATAATTPAAILKQCQAAIEHDIDMDETWGLHVIRLSHAQYATAFNLRPCWEIWVDVEGQGLRRCLPTSTELEAPITGLLALDPVGMERARQMYPTLSVDELAAGWRKALAGFEAATDAEFSFTEGNFIALRHQPGVRRLTLQSVYLRPEMLTPVFRQVEFALMSDGMNAAVARRLCCGLLDLAERGQSGQVQIEWADGRALLTVAAPGVHEPEQTGWWDQVMTGSDTVVFVFLTRPEESIRDAGSTRRRGYPDAETAGRSESYGFDVVRLPSIVTGTVVRAVAADARGKSRLALDGLAVRYISSSALGVLNEMADDRRGGPAEGRFCVMGLSSILTRLIRVRKVDQALDLLTISEALESLGRRLTSMSERSALLNSIIT